MPAREPVTPGDGSATVSWLAPSKDGGSAITLYTVTASTGPTATSTTTSVTVSGLTNGTAVAHPGRLLQGMESFSNVMAANQSPALGSSETCLSGTARL